MYGGMNRNEIRGLMTLVVLIAIGVGIQTYRAREKESGIWVQVLPGPSPASTPLVAGLRPVRPTQVPSPSPTPANVQSAHPILHTATQVSPPQKVTPPQASPAPSPVLSSLSVPATGPVNINTASQAELETLWNIGPKTAVKIIDWRNAHGPFRSVQELDGIPGIGPVTIQRNLHRMCTASPSSP